MPTELKSSNDVSRYLAKLDSDLPGIQKNTPVVIEELIEGYINRVYRVYSREQGNSFLIKQTLPYLKARGHKWPLDVNRFQIEVQALRFYDSIVPEHVPKLLTIDRDNKVLITEFLEGYQTLDKYLNRFSAIDKFDDQISHFLARTHFRSSPFFLSSHQMKKNRSKYTNPSIETISEELVFSTPFIESQLNKIQNSKALGVRIDGELKIQIGKLKHKFMTKAQGLIHGDLHLGSIMSNGREIKVIDPEFAFVGPFGYDVGLVICSLIISHLYIFSSTTLSPIERTSFSEYLYNLIVQIWEKYSYQWAAQWEEAENQLFPSDYWKFEEGKKSESSFIQSILNDIQKDTLGFAGCRILAGILGFITFPNIERIDDLRVKAKIEQCAINIGRRLILEQDSMTGFYDLVDLLKSETIKLQENT